MVQSQHSALAGSAQGSDRASLETRLSRDIARSNHFYARFAKPAFDRVAGLFLLVVFAPVLAAVAVIVRWKLGSPVIYLQRRVGRSGSELRLVKFRTMLSDRRVRNMPPEGPDRRMTHKTDADPRHTNFGRHLRRTTLDELPQLLHVVRGDMSLVGPRPELHSVVEAKYEPWQHQRHVVKPGITGLWQITAREAGRAMYEDTDVDLQYIEKMSFRYDLRILLATPLVALGRDTSSVAPSVESG
jgi:lipopolysaccharide/colanic/teichoic acid biosynthesis glycosyltransferase